MLTLSTESEFSEVKFMIHNEGWTMYISPGTSFENVYDPDTDGQANIVPYFFRSQ